MSDAVTRLLDEGTVRPVLRRPPRSRMRIGLAATLLVVYAGIVLAATMSPTPLDRGYTGAIDKVLAVLHRNGLPAWFDYAEVEFLANVMMFVPLGFLVGIALGRWMWLGILLIPGFSAAIEWTQATFLAQRFATAQDIVANTIGGYCGLLVAMILVAMVHARDEKVIARAVWDAQFGAQAARRR